MANGQVKNILTDFLNQGAAAGTDFAKQFVFGKLQGTPEGVIEQQISQNDLNGSGAIDSEGARALPQTLEETITGKASSPDPVIAQTNTPMILFGVLIAVLGFAFLATKR